MLRYQSILKTTVSGVFEDLKFKISEGSDQNCPESALLAVSVSTPDTVAFTNLNTKLGETPNVHTT